MPLARTATVARRALTLRCALIFAPANAETCERRKTHPQNLVSQHPHRRARQLASHRPRSRRARRPVVRLPTLFDPPSRALAHRIAHLGRDLSRSRRRANAIIFVSHTVPAASLSRAPSARRLRKRPRPAIARDRPRSTPRARSPPRPRRSTRADAHDAAHARGHFSHAHTRADQGARRVASRARTVKAIVVVGVCG